MKIKKELTIQIVINMNKSQEHNRVQEEQSAGYIQHVKNERSHV